MFMLKIGSEFKTLLKNELGLNDTGWINMNLINNWQAHDIDYSQPQYRKIGDMVYLRGLIRRDVAGDRVFATLPEGFRPLKSSVYTDKDENQNDVYVLYDGNVRTSNSYINGTWLTLDGIIFSIA